MKDFIIFKDVCKYYQIVDIFIKSTLGLTKEDIKHISNLKEVEQIMSAYATDILMEIHTNENEDYNEIDDVYNTTDYTVVGVVANPFYFSKEREPSSIGNGRVGAIIYVDEASYALDV